MDTPEIVLTRVWNDLQSVNVLWQVAVFAISIGLAFLIWYVLRPRIARVVRQNKWGAALGGLRRLVVPPLALALMILGRSVLAHHQSVMLLDIAIALALSLAIVRLLVHIMQLVFAPGATLYAFERTLVWLIWLAFALHVVGLAPEIIGYLNEITFQIGKQQISLLVIGQALLWIVVALLVALWFGRLLEERLMGAATLDLSLRIMLTKFVRALLALLAILIVLPAVGIDLTALSVLGGAIGVGIGFGLQKIASNYISGFIILFDRSVKIGDLVTVDNRTGQLSQMTARYVVVRSLDGTEAIIPNETLITSTVINHSYSEPRTAFSVQVLVDYATDVELALRTMVEVAKRQPRVLATPGPGAVIKSFADYGIRLELGMWIDDPEKGHGGLCSEIYLDLLREFRAHSIKIPMPQQEVRVTRQEDDAPPGRVPG